MSPRIGVTRRGLTDSAEGRAQLHIPQTGRGYTEVRVQPMCLRSRRLSSSAVQGCVPRMRAHTAASRSRTRPGERAVVGRRPYDADLAEHRSTLVGCRTEAGSVVAHPSTPSPRRRQPPGRGRPTQTSYPGRTRSSPGGIPFQVSGLAGPIPFTHPRSCGYRRAGQRVGAENGSTSARGDS